MSECAGAGCTHPEHSDRVIVKYDGNGKPMYDNDPRLGNREQRRALAREARRR